MRRNTAVSDRGYIVANVRRKARAPRIALTSERERDMQASTLPHGSATAHYEAARRLVDLGRDEEASKRLDAAIAARPAFAEAFSLGGYILERSGRADTAMRFYRRALELKPELPAAWSNLAKLLLKQGAFVDALRAIDTSLLHLPGDADAWNTRAGVARALGRLQESEQRRARPYDCARIFRKPP